jgi:hypothetical protein
LVPPPRKRGGPPKKVAGNFATLALATPALGEAKGAAAAAPNNQKSKDKNMTNANAKPHDDNNQSPKATIAVEPIDKVTFFPIEAAIWKNLSKDGASFYAVTFERKYRDQEEKWKSSNRFDVADLLLLAKVADLAHSKIVELRASDRQMKPPIK